MVLGYSRFEQQQQKNVGDEINGWCGAFNRNLELSFSKAQS